jgi:hypothetical protein
MGVRENHLVRGRGFAQGTFDVAVRILVDGILDNPQQGGQEQRRILAND